MLSCPALRRPVDSQNYGPLKSGVPRQRWRQQHCSSCGRDAPQHDGGSWEAGAPGKGPSSPARPARRRPAAVPRSVLGPADRSAHAAGRHGCKTRGQEERLRGSPGIPPIQQPRPPAGVSGASLSRASVACAPLARSPGRGRAPLTATSASPRPGAPPAPPEPTGRSFRAGLSLPKPRGHRQGAASLLRRRRQVRRVSLRARLTCGAAKTTEARGFTPWRLCGGGAQHGLSLKRPR